MAFTSLTRFGLRPAARKVYMTRVEVRTGALTLFVFSTQIGVVIHIKAF